MGFSISASSKYEDPNVGKVDARAVEQPEKRPVAATKLSKVEEPGVGKENAKTGQLKDKNPAVATEQILLFWYGAAVKCVEPNLAQNEKRTVAAVEIKEKTVAAAGGENKAVKITDSEKVQREWACALCQVTIPSEKDLDSHLQGRKHKAKFKRLVAKSDNNKAEFALATLSRALNLRSRSREIPSSAYGGGGGGRDLLEHSKSIPVIVVRSSSPLRCWWWSSAIVEASSSLVSSEVVVGGGLGWLWDRPKTTSFWEFSGFGSAVDGEVSDVWYASIRAIENNSNSEMRNVVAYWILFSLVSLFELAFVKLIDWPPVWPYIKLLAMCLLVLPHFNGASYVYECLLRPCLSVDPRAAIKYFIKPKEDKKLDAESFLADVDRYVQENGSEALEKFLDRKSKHTKPDIGMEVMKAMTYTEEKDTAAAIKSKYEEPNVGKVDARAVELPQKSPVAATKLSTVSEPHVDKENANAGELKDESPAVATEQLASPWNFCSLVNSVEPNLVQNEKKAVATTGQLKGKNPAVATEQAARLTTMRSNLNPSRCQVKRVVPNLAQNEKKTVGAGEIKGETVAAAGGEKKALEITDSEKVQREWTCALCQVTTTCEEDLNSHLQGRKHMDKCEELKASKKVNKNPGSSSWAASPEPKEILFGSFSLTDQTNIKSRIQRIRCKLMWPLILEGRGTYPILSNLYLVVWVKGFIRIIEAVSYIEFEAAISMVVLRGWNRMFAFGKMLIIGSEPPFKVNGLWLFHGQQIPQFIIDECYDMELYDWKKVDVSDQDQKERVSQMIEDQDPFEGEALLDAKCFNLESDNNKAEFALATLSRALNLSSRLREIPSSAYGGGGGSGGRDLLERSKSIPVIGVRSSSAYVVGGGDRRSWRRLLRCRRPTGLGKRTSQNDVVLGVQLMVKYASIRAIENNSNSEMRNVVAYWILFSLVSLFELAFVKLIDWPPVWPYIKLLAMCLLVLPHFNGASYVYECLLRPCLSVDPRAAIKYFIKPKEDKKLDAESFLADVDRYVQENGSEALEKFLDRKSKHTKPDIGMEVMKAMTYTEEKDTAAAIKSKYEEPNVGKVDARAVELPQKSPVAATKLSTVSEPHVDKENANAGELKDESPAVATEQLASPWNFCSLVNCAEPNLAQNEKKAVATTGQLKGKNPAVATEQAARLTTMRSNLNPSRCQVKRVVPNIAQNEKKTVGAGEIKGETVAAAGGEKKAWR
ncbi:hypothetical protein RHSIM_Rhsim11G0142600 [Rhododendron simsii]|uniref:EF-1-gamma C-terminal domain-containing protein n=1 Tax=Rhododendron simsii TaxID=118357 RepID=A0A834G924_RHOSS|nr:hypothetical protein RHSIM_Rhsim11G0142600 [Rhododendron simsii]